MWFLGSQDSLSHLGMILKPQYSCSKRANSALSFQEDPCVFRLILRAFLQIQFVLNFIFFRPEPLAEMRLPNRRKIGNIASEGDRNKCKWLF